MAGFKVSMSGGGDDLLGAAVREIERQMTKKARTIDCPEHRQRSPNAKARLNQKTNHFEFSGVCCDALVMKLAKELS